MDWLDFAAIIVSVIALGLSIYQFFVERKVNRMEATINAFAELQKEVLNQEEYFKADIIAILEKHKKIKGSSKDADWELISEYLARLEQFSVGINMDVYSVDVVDRMAGSYLIKEFNRLLPIIDYKRFKGNTNKRYEEFEMMVKKLSHHNPDIELKAAYRVS